MKQLLEFDLKLNEQPVILKDAKGVPTHYTLREMDGNQRDEHMQDSASRMKFDEKGNAKGLSSYKGIQSKLISLCLFDAEGKPVPEKTINAWPATTISGLFKAAQQLNSLGDDAEAAAKNASLASASPGSNSPTVSDSPSKS